MNSMTDKSPLKVVVTHSFGASQERVFDAWLDPEMVGKWMFSPTLLEQEVVSISVDPRVGGSFSFVVRRHGKEIDHIGKYLEIERPRRLVFTWGVKQDSGDSSRVMVDIIAQGTGSELTLTHELDPAWADYESRTRDSWTKMLQVLDDTLSATTSAAAR
jgi:uncharacterized protein YndB with AHSA1/START domain